MTTLRHLLARSAIAFCVLLPWLAPELRAEDPPPPTISVSGTIVDDCDGLVPVGGPVVFELTELGYTYGDQTGEYPDGTWVIEWSLNQTTWMTPASHPNHFEDPPSALRFVPLASELAQTGSFTVYCRISVTPPEAANGSSPALRSETVRIVALGTLQYSTDGGATWDTYDQTLQVAPGDTVRFKVLPQGAELLPEDAVKWQYSVGDGDQSPVGSIVGITFNTGSPSATTPYPVAVALGTSQKAASVLVGGLDHLEYCVVGYTNFADAGGLIYVPVGEQVQFRAVFSPENRQVAVGDVAWAGGVTGSSTDADLASITFTTESASVSSPTMVSATLGNKRSVSVVACGISGLEYSRSSVGGPFDPVPDMIETVAGQPLYFHAVITPAGASWPEDCPRWTEDTRLDPMAGGYAAFSPPQEVEYPGVVASITADCGSTSRGATIKILPPLALFCDGSFLSVGGTVQVTAKRFDGTDYVAHPCNWTLPAGATKVQFVGATADTSTVTLQGVAVSDSFQDIRLQASTTNPTTLSCTAKFTVVDIDLQWRLPGGTYATAPETIYLPKGETAEFKAVVNPSPIVWPTAPPVWTGATPTGSGTASWTGSTVSASIGDVHTVTVSCGEIVSTNLVVYDLDALAWRLDEDDAWHTCGEVVCVPKNAGTYQLRTSIVPDGVPESETPIVWTSVTPPPEGMSYSSSTTPATISPDAGDWLRITVGANPVPPDSTDNYTTYTVTRGPLSRTVRGGTVGIDHLTYGFSPMPASRNCPSTGATSVPAGTPVKVTAILKPSNGQLPPELPMAVWPAPDGAYGLQMATNTEEIVVTWQTVSETTADQRVVTVSYAGETHTAHFVVCTVDKLLYKEKSTDSYEDAKNLIVTMPNSPLYFKAVIRPAGAAWPGNPPDAWPADLAKSTETTPLWEVWSSYSGQSHDIRRESAGSQEEVKVTFSQATRLPQDYSLLPREVINASCGAGSVNAYVVVVNGFRILPERDWVTVGGTVTVKAWTVDENNTLVNTDAQNWTICGEEPLKASIAPSGVSQSAVVTGGAVTDGAAEEVKVKATQVGTGTEAVTGLHVIELQKLRAWPQGGAEVASPDPLLLPAILEGEIPVFSALDIRGGGGAIGWTGLWELTVAANGWSPEKGTYTGNIYTAETVFRNDTGLRVPTDAAHRVFNLTGGIDLNNDGSLGPSDTTLTVPIILTDVGSLKAILLNGAELDTAKETAAGADELYLPYEPNMKIRLQATSFPAAAGGAWPPGFPYWLYGEDGATTALPGWDGHGGSALVVGPPIVSPTLLYPIDVPSINRFTAICGNQVSTTVTAVLVDLHADLNGDGTVGTDDPNDSQENESPGLVIGLSKAAKVEATLGPDALALGTVRLKGESVSGGGSISVWDNEECTGTPILSMSGSGSAQKDWPLYAAAGPVGAFSLASVPSQYWVRGNAAGQARLTLKYMAPDGTEISDEVLVSILDVGIDPDSPLVVGVGEEGTCTLHFLPTTINKGVVLLSAASTGDTTVSDFKMWDGPSATGDLLADLANGDPGELWSLDPDTFADLPGNLTFCAQRSGDITLTLLYTSPTGAEVRDELRVPIVEVERIRYKLSNMNSYADFSGSLKVVKGESVTFQAVTNPPAASLPAASIQWGGSFGTSGTGETASHAHDSSYAASDADVLKVTAQCGNTVEASVIVCRYVLGAHSNRSTQANGMFDAFGHAWVSVTDYSTSPPAADSYGLFAIVVDNDNDGNPDTMVVNASGYANMNAATYSRYYAISPGQYSDFVAFISVYHAYTYVTYNCSSWASDLIDDVIGEDVDSDSSLLGIETPAEFGESIILLEGDDPSSLQAPSAIHR